MFVFPDQNQPLTSAGTSGTEKLHLCVLLFFSSVCSRPQRTFIFTDFESSYVIVLNLGSPLTF